MSHTQEQIQPSFDWHSVGDMSNFWQPMPGTLAMTGRERWAILQTELRPPAGERQTTIIRVTVYAIPQRI